ncbi:hypothetical protein DXK93_10905 [Achromobacter sp. K91]|uniref:hypothetical protein n=1 Tax=Achromobacter sp. K91 TaxID=2292262 RepID=UPI000E6675C2|nr:hypothetical protein [Achromobacter sp. K91]RIJ04062.1 hypothetical protein DXK93_10905 [Achromobacter sp. K91]
MDIDISWSLIFKAALAWLGVYFLSPTLLILRDKLLWRAIDKFVMDKPLRDAILMVVRLEKQVAEGALAQFGPEPDAKYLIGDRVVSKSEYESEIRMRQEELKAQELIARRRSTLDALIRYFKQPPELNPIDLRLKRGRESWKATMSVIETGTGKSILDEMRETAAAPRGTQPPTDMPTPPDKQSRP